MKNLPIFLIGSRACGKSTIGKALAKRLGWAFVDTDVLVEEKHTSSIAHIVEKHGWDLFRKYESQTLRECIKPKRVISTGGGMVLAKANRELMQQSGLVFFLSVPVQELMQRININDNHRPALTDKGTVQEVELVLSERLPLYQQTAHYEVDGSQSVLQIVDKLHDIVMRKC